MPPWLAFHAICSGNSKHHFFFNCKSDYSLCCLKHFKGFPLHFKDEVFNIVIKVPCGLILQLLISQKAPTPNSKKEMVFSQVLRMLWPPSFVPLHMQPFVKLFYPHPPACHTPPALSSMFTSTEKLHLPSC